MTNSFLDKYLIIEKIGEGSFSEVLKVQDNKTGTFYAAKKLNRIYLNADEVMSCTEIKAMKNLEYHQNVVGIVDIVFGELPGNLTLIFELMDMSMYDYIKNRKRCLSELRVKFFLYQLICGLQHLHSNGIFHRDIKPENILVKINHNLKHNPLKAESVQIADLGSVCEIYKTQPHSAYISTRWYRAPECLLTSGYYGSKMDIWAIGCVYYEMLTLNPLFPGENELDQLHKIHDVIGTPTLRILQKFKRRNIDYNFPKRKPIGLYNLLPMLSDYGIDILNKTLAYHPDMRSSVYRLYEHAYFNDIRLKTYGSASNGFTSTPSLIASPSAGKQSSQSKRLTNSAYTMTTESKTTCNKKTKILSCISLNLNNNKSKTRFISNTSSTVNTLHSSDSDTKNVKKQLERAWGMNPGPGKSAIMKNIQIKSNQK